MAMINCGECGRSISDQAVACPGCGAPVLRSPTRTAVPVSSSNGRQILLAVLGLAAIGIVGLGILAIVPAPKNAGQSVSSAQQHDRDVIETCHADYAKKKDDPRMDRNALALVYTVCEKLENDYRAKWGKEP